VTRGCTAAAAAGGVDGGGDGGRVAGGAAPCPEATAAVAVGGQAPPVSGCRWYSCLCCSGSCTPCGGDGCCCGGCCWASGIGAVPRTVSRPIAPWTPSSGKA